MSTTEFEFLSELDVRQEAFAEQFFGETQMVQKGSELVRIDVKCMLSQDFLIYKEKVNSKSNGGLC